MDVSQIDQQTIADLNGIAEARRLAAVDQRRLANYVSGAVRPNRDRPVFDLIRIVAEVAAKVTAGKPGGRTDVDRCLGLLLGPASAVQAMVKGKLPTGELHALLGFAEFLLTHDDCKYFPEMRRHIETLARAGDAGREAAIKEVVSEIASRLRTYRTERFPVARHEKVFRSLLSFLGERGRTGGGIGFTDTDIVDFWEREIRDGNRLLYRTVVKHFLTLETVAAEVSAQRAINDAASLYDGDEGRVLAPVETITEGLEDVGESPAARLEALAGFLEKGVPDSVKLLTGIERDHLSALVDCGTFSSSRPLTVLRYISFGQVQSGIANFLRRGSGGGAIAERVKCADAELYSDVHATYGKLSAHLEKLLLISAFLASEHGTAGAEAIAGVEPQVLAQARREGAGFLKRMKREGFDAAPEMLATNVLPVAGQLVSLKIVAQQFVDSVSGLEKAAPLDKRFEEDRRRFSEVFSAAYMTPQNPGVVPFGKAPGGAR